MVIFKNRWIKKFLNNFKNKNKDNATFYSTYRGYMPSNVSVFDVVKVAKEGHLQDFLTVPYRPLMETSTPEYYQASPNDGYYFFKDPKGPDFIACYAEMGHLADIVKSQDIAVAFQAYLGYQFMQLQSRAT